MNDTVVSPVTVTPKQDAQGNTRRNPKNEDARHGRFRGRQQRGDGTDPVPSERPLVNSYGQVIGQTVNITA